MTYCEMSTEPKNYEQDFYAYPQTPEFGAEQVGNTTTIAQGIYTWATGCGASQAEAITVDGPDATEFSIEDMQCYQGLWSESSYSSCYFTIVFSPTSAGVKAAELSILFNDNTVETLPLQAQAVAVGQPAIAVSPVT